MKLAARTGLAINAVCDPLIDSATAPMRSAMNRSASGGIALSCSDTRNQEGLVLHLAAVAFSVSAASESGRCVANMTSARSTGTSAQNVSRICSFAMYRSGPCAGAGRVVRRRVEGGREHRRRERSLHAGAALTHVDAERGEVDKPGHVVQP